MGGKAKHGILPKGAYYDEPTATWTSDDYNNYDDYNYSDPYAAEDTYGSAEQPWPNDLDESYFKGKTSRKKGAKGNGGKQKGTSGACHICGQVGHWKNECPQKSLFLDTDHADHAAANHLFHSEGARDSVTPLFWAGGNEDEDQVIELGAAWPGEEVVEPTFTYMVVQEEPFEEANATTESAQAPSAPSPTTNLAAGTCIPVSGMLEVRGSLQVMADGTMGLQLHLAAQPLQPFTPGAPPATTTTQQSAQAAYSFPSSAAPAVYQSVHSGHSTSSMAASIAATPSPAERSQSPASNFRRDATGNAVYDMRQLLGVEVTVDESRRTTRGKKKEARKETPEENSWFFETVEAEPESENLSGPAYAASPPQPSRNSHQRAVTSQPTLLPDSGAVTNLIGSLRAKEFSKAAKALGHSVMWTKLTQPRIVSGVGGTGSACQYMLTVSGRVGPRTILRYRAPVISGTSEGVPALLGLQEQTAARAVLLPQSRRLMILPPQSTEQDIQFPEQTASVHLERAPSGHLLIPFLRPESARQHNKLVKHDDAQRDSNHHCHWGIASKATTALMACAALTNQLH
eukprot:6490895-Amphidinium_carterae.1